MQSGAGNCGAKDVVPSLHERWSALRIDMRRAINLRDCHRSTQSISCDKLLKVNAGEVAERLKAAVC
jgi:hypothetical protein